MFSYLAAALPGEISADARFVALQCALRMGVQAEVRLPTGFLRGLRLGHDPGPLRELEQARWLYRIPEIVGTVRAVRLLDPALLTQSPARADRVRAADWALRVAASTPPGAIDPTTRLVSVYLAAHTGSGNEHGQCELGRMIHDCGLTVSSLPTVLDRLMAVGAVESWESSPDLEDLFWVLPGGPVPSSVSGLAD